MSAAESIHQTLELLACEVDDLTPLVYTRFYERSPAGKALLQDKPAFVQGRMINEVIQAVVDVADGRNYLATLVETEVNSHNVWGVTPDMYEELFGAFVDTATSLLGERFDAAMQTAWRDAFTQLERMIQPHAKPIAHN